MKKWKRFVSPSPGHGGRRVYYIRQGVNLSASGAGGKMKPGDAACHYTQNLGIPLDFPLPPL